MRVGLGTLALSIVAFLFVPFVASANQRLTIQRQLVAAAAPTSQLQQVESVESFGTRFYRFRQEVAGVPVLGAETIVTDAPGRQADLLLDLSRPGIERRPPQRVVCTSFGNRGRQGRSAGRAPPHGRAGLTIHPPAIVRGKAGLARDPAGSSSAGKL